MKPNLLEIEDPLSVEHDAHYFSRKLDGYFATYDTHRECFVSSAGNAFVTPASHKLPADMLRHHTIAGELVHRDGFEATAVVRRTRGVPDWTGITFHPFDLHDNRANYQWLQRYRDLLSLCSELRPYLVGHGLADVRPIIHKSFVPLDVKDQARACVEFNLEGLVFRNERSLMTDKVHGYKWKNKRDMDGVLVATRSGEGRCRSMPGATLVVEYTNPKTRQRALINIGGKDDATRRNPPPLGSTIVFQYRLLSETGVPQKPILKEIRPCSPPKQS